MSRVPAVLLLAMAVGFGACASLPGAAPNLEGTGWRAILVAGTQPVHGSEPTAWFDGGRISGSAGCNRYGGLARVEGGRLTVTEGTMTLADCDGPAASIQKLFMEAISAGLLGFESGNLVITGAERRRRIPAGRHRPLRARRLRTPVRNRDGSPAAG